MPSIVQQVLAQRGSSSFLGRGKETEGGHNRERRTDTHIEFAGTERGDRPQDDMQQDTLPRAQTHAYTDTLFTIFFIICICDSMSWKMICRNKIYITTRKANDTHEWYIYIHVILCAHAHPDKGGSIRIAYSHTHTYTHTHIRPLSLLHTWKCLRTRAQPRARAYVWSHTHIHTHALSLTQMQTNTHTRTAKAGAFVKVTHTHIHIHTLSLTHTCKRIRAQPKAGPAPAAI